MGKSTRHLINTRYGQQAKVPIRRVLGRLGFEVVPLHRPSRAHLLSAIRRSGAASTIDVGANRGQFATSLRTLGFKGPILSIEPMSSAFEGLTKASRADPRWQVVKCAAGDQLGVAQLNVSQNSTSSSLLRITDLHLRAEASSQVVRTEEVETRTLDEIIENHGCSPPYFLKMDVQGGELGVLNGAQTVLAGTRLLLVEASIRELYTGGCTYLDLLTRIHEEGFAPIALEPAFEDPVTGDLLQVDILALSRDLL